MQTTYIVEITIPVKPSANKKAAELQTNSDRQRFIRNLNDAIKIAGKDAKAKFITEV